MPQQEKEIAEYLELRQRRAKLKEVYEMHDQQLKDEQDDIERRFIGLLKSTGGSVSLPTGRATHTIKKKIQVQDQQDFKDFIIADPAERIHLLQSRVAPKAHDEYTEAHGITEVPGLHYEQFHAVTFFKSTKSRRNR